MLSPKTRKLITFANERFFSNDGKLIALQVSQQQLTGE